MLLTHCMALARALALASAGSNNAAMIAMIAMTTSNSISVKAHRFAKVLFICNLSTADDEDWHFRIFVKAL
jgi:hypothetical protein